MASHHDYRLPDPPDTGHGIDINSVRPSIEDLLQQFADEISIEGQHEYVRNKILKHHDQFLSIAWIAHLTTSHQRESEIYFLQNAINKFYRHFLSEKKINLDLFAELCGTMEVIEQLIKKEKHRIKVPSRMHQLIDELRTKLPFEALNAKKHSQGYLAALKRAQKGKYPKFFKQEIQKLAATSTPCPHPSQKAGQ